MKLNRDSLKLYGVISKNNMSEAEYLNKIERSIKGGVTILQIREKQGTHKEIVNLCLKVKSITDKYNIPLIINDDVSICKEIDANGVHLGQSDGSVEEAREILGDDKIIGVSANTMEEAKKAVMESADYLGTGAMFTTYTKLDAENVTMQTLSEICSNSEVPVVAIGGIDQNNLHFLKGTAIAGVAVVSALYSDGDTFNNASELKKAVEEVLLIENKKFIICDVDGVILDSVDIWKGVASAYLNSKGITPEDRLDEKLSVLSFDKGIELLQNDYGITEDTDTILNSLYNIVKDRYINDINPKPYAYKFLKHLSKNKCIYLCSDTKSDVLIPALKKHGLMDFADALITSDITNCYKNDKQIYLYCNEKSGYSIDETVVLEDYLYPIKTAKSAGYYVIGVKERNSVKHEEEIKKTADKYINELSELIEVNI